MFEGLLEKLLQKILGQYVEELDRKNLSVSIWRGNIELENLQLRRDIFQRMNIPLNIVFGKISKLKMIVPWNALSSQSVQLFIEQVSIVVCPKGKDEWDVIKDTIQTNADLRKVFIDNFAAKLYEDLIKAQEVAKEQQGMLKRMLTRTIDNLQVSIQCLHMRFESYNPLFSKDLFSMGFTLQHLKIYTTNENWQASFLDRTYREAALSPLFKVLDISDLGFYYRTDDTNFIGELDGEKLKQQKLVELFGIGQSKAKNYGDCYLLEPIKLLCHLRFDPMKQDVNIQLEMDHVDICMQKNQLANIIRLVELDNEYTELQNTYQAQERDKYQAELAAQIFDQEEVMARFQELYVKCGKFKIQDGQKEIGPQKALSSIETEIFQLIILGTDTELLKKWASVVCEEEAKTYLATVTREQQRQDSKVGMRAYLKSFFVAKVQAEQLQQQAESQQDEQYLELASDFFINDSSTTEAQAAKAEASDKNSSSEDEFFDAKEELDEGMIDALQEQEEETKEVVEQINTSSVSTVTKKFEELKLTKQKSMEPQQAKAYITSQFRLGHFCLTLVYNSTDKQGITINSRELSISFIKYDINNTMNPNAWEMVCQNKDFSIKSLTLQKDAAIIEKIPQAITEDENYFMCRWAITKHSLNFKNQQKLAMSPDDPEQFDVDITLDMQLKPVRIVYRPTEVEKLNNFFYVENIKDETKFKAQQQLDSMKQKFKDHQKSLLLQSSKKMSKIRIDIECPVLELPFSNNPLVLDELTPNCVNEEKWVFAMGNLSLTNYDEVSDPKTGVVLNRTFGANDPQIAFYKCFKLGIENSCFQHEKGYTAAMEKSQLAPIMPNVNVDLLIFVRRTGKTRADVPKLKILGKISEISVMLTPYTYCHFVNLSKLFYPDTTSVSSKKPEQSASPMSFATLKKKAQFSGALHKQRYPIKYLDKFYCILSTGSLFFFKPEESSYAAAQGPKSETEKKPSEDSDVEEERKTKHQTHFEIYKNLETLFHQKGYYSKPDESLKVAQESFSVKGCDKLERLSSTSVLVKNYYGQQCELHFDAEEEATRWQHAIEANAKQMAIVSNLATSSDAQSVLQPCSDAKAKDQPNQDAVEKLIQIKIPCVKLILKTEKKDLKQELEEYDPEDAGIFSRKDSPIDKWKLIIAMKDMEITQTRTAFVSDMQIKMSSLKLKEDASIDKGKSLQRLSSIDSKLRNKDRRFPTLMKSDKGMSVGIVRCDRAWSGYENEDMTVTMQFDGQFILNWQPLAMNRLVRFLKFMKFKSQVSKLELHQWLFRYKSFNLLQKSGSGKEKSRSSDDSAGSNFRDQERAHNSDDSAQQQSQQHSHIEDCSSEPQILYRVLAKFNAFKIICIHPQNETYPIFSLLSENLVVDYLVHFDHQIYDITFPILQINDHTNHPNTYDPTKTYTSKDKLDSFLIFAKRSVNVAQDTLRVRVLTFTAPLEKTCPLARDEKMKAYDKHVKIDMGSSRLVISKEYLYRIYEYMYYQMQMAVSDANPYWPLMQRCQTDFKELLKQASGSQNVPEREYIRHPYSNALTSHLFNDLQQSPYCTGIEMVMHYPLFIVKDRNYLKLGKIRVEANDLQITTGIQNVTGRYRKQPNRQLLVGTTSVKFRGATMHYTCGKSERTADKLYTVIAPMEINCVRESISYSPFLSDQGLMSPDFDFEDLDISQRYTFKCSPVKIFLIQEILTYLMRVSDLNLNYQDGKQNHFQLAVWNDADKQKYIRLEEETRKKFKDNTIVHNRLIELYYPSLSMTLFNDDDDHSPYGSMIAEIVFWNYNLSLKYFPDWNKHLVITSHSLNILRLATELCSDESRLSRHDKPPGLAYAMQQCKATVLGHVSAHNYIVTDEDFYNFNVDKLIQSDGHSSHSNSMQDKSASLWEVSAPRRDQHIKLAQQLRKRRAMLEKKNFTMDVAMKADGEKIYKIKFNEPKMSMRMDIFLMVGEFFSTASPLYSKQSRDQPNNYSWDPNAARRQEILLELKEGLIVFENAPGAKQTVVCQGSVIMTKTRETINTIKLKLLDRYDKTAPADVAVKALRRTTTIVRQGSAQSPLKPSLIKPKLSQSNNQPNDKNMPDDVEYDYSAKTKIFLLSLTDFCPYFCSTADLDGKQFRYVQKRELMKPFNMHFNKTDMIELKMREDVQDDSLFVFKTFKNKDASLDWTFLKISFQDLQILQQIMEHNLELIKSRMARYEALAEADNSDGTSFDSDSDSNSNDVSNSDILDSSDSGSNESYHSTKRTESGPEKAVEAESKPRLSAYSKRRSILPKLGGSAHSLHKNLTSEEEKENVDQSPFARQRRNNVNQSAVRSSFIKDSSNSSSNELRQTKIGFAQAHNFFETLNKIRSYQTRRRTIINQIFEDGNPENDRNQQQPVSGDFYFTANRNQNNSDSIFMQMESKNVRLHASSSGEKCGSKLIHKARSQQAHKNQTDKTNKFRGVVIEEVDDELDESIIPSDDEAGFSESHVAMIGASEEASSFSQPQSSSLVDLDFGMGRVNIMAVDLDRLEAYDNSEVIQVVKEEQGDDNVQVMSYGIQIMIINDNCGNFMPVLGTSISTMCYQYGLQNGIKTGKTSFSCSVSYFNAMAGCWEPTVEKFNVTLQNTHSNGLKQILVTMDKEININITESLLKTLKDAHDSFNSANHQNNENHAQVFQNTKAKESLIKSKTIIDFDDKDAKEQPSTNLSDMEVTPYSICNMTEASIAVCRIVDPDTAKKLQENKLRKLRTMQSQHMQAIDDDESFDSQSDKNSQIPLPKARPQIIEETKNEQLDICIPVLKVHSCETKNYGVNYESQVQRQVNQFRHSNTSQKHEELIHIQFNRQSKAPIENINLNSNKMDKYWRHYYRSPKYKEFILYGVSLKNLKRVLTLRTQYLLRNDTLLDYHVKIINLFEKDKTSAEMKLLKSGQSLPLPEGYNQSAMQLRLSSEPESDWSIEWPIYAIKKIVKANDPGYMRHGSTFTYFCKKPQTHPDTFDLVLMPPLVVQNCLPIELRVEFVDSNRIFQKLLIEKEETRNIFQFDLQQKIELRLKIEGYSSALIRLATTISIDEEREMTIQIADSMNRKLELRAMVSHQTAGHKITFFVTNCLINSTDQNLLFFYEQPSPTTVIQEADRCLMVSEPLEVVSSPQLNEKLKKQTSKKVHMLSRCKQVFAKIEGSKEISQIISTYAPGTRDKFQLQRKNMLYEFGYATQMYLANRNEFIYTKVTTISPLFILVNCTQSTILFAQECSKNMPLFVKPDQQLPFHWNEKDMPKRVSVKIIPGEEDQDRQANFNWTIDFPLSEAGSLTLITREIKEEHFLDKHKKQEEVKRSFFFSSDPPKKVKAFLKPVCRTKRRFLRINRRQNLHQMFIVVEEEAPELCNMKIENCCESYGFVFQQAGNTSNVDVDVCDASKSEAFTWTDPEGKRELLIRLYENNYKFDTVADLGLKNSASTKAVNNKLYVSANDTMAKQISVSMDELNKPTEKVNVFKQVNGQFIPLKPVYISVITNGYTKILRIQDTRDDANEEESKDLEPSDLTSVQVQISMINFSIVETGRELLTLYLEGIQAKLDKTPTQNQFFLWLTSMQIDNQTETYPLYPVILKPAQAWEYRQGNGLNLPLFFRLALVTRRNVPNVVYIELLEFLLRGVEIKLELSHIVQITEFLTRVGRIFNRNYIKQHSIFQRYEGLQPEAFDSETQNPFQNLPLRSDPSILRGGDSDNYVDMQFQQQILKKNALSKLRVSQFKKRQSIRRKTKLAVHGIDDEELFQPMQHKQSKLRHNRRHVVVNDHEDELIQEGQNAIKRLYIKAYRGTPLDMRLTLIKHLDTQTQENEEKSFFKTIGQLGLTLTTVENAPVKINALEVNNVFGDKSEVTNLFKCYYKQQIKSNMINFIGASNLIGNPISFLNTVGTGIKDFWYEPTQGMMIGPAETASGFYRGTKSLIGNTMSASVHSLGKISSSLSSTLLNITGDTEYMQQRNIGMIQRRPAGVLQGIEQGVGSALNSSWSGIRGLITKPNEGYQREGASGFLKGALSGTAGLFVKPLAGAMDFVSKTTEGIQNASKSAEELAQDERLRPPRAFYRKEQVIMDFDNAHANLLSIVPQLRYRNSDNALQQVNCKFFQNAWIVEERHGFLDWSVIFMTQDCLCRIVRFSYTNALRQAMAEDRQIRYKIVEGSLVQIMSVNMLSDLVSIEIHEGKVLDIEFRDGREIVTIKDIEMAHAIKERVESLYREQMQEQQGTAMNSLLYKQNTNVMVSANKKESQLSRKNTLRSPRGTPKNQ